MEHAAQLDAAHAQRRVRGALWCAALCVLGLALTWLVAAHVPAARLSDAAALRGFIGLDHRYVDLVANGVLALVDPVTCTLFALGAMAVAWRRGRRRLALAVPIVLIGAVESAELLKPLLATSHAYVDSSHVIDPASWPSGHSTAAMTVTLCALLVAPRRWRPAVAAIGGVFTVAVGFSLLTLAWHMPSDVIGGFLLSALWVSAAVAVLAHADAREPARSPSAVAAARRPRRRDRSPVPSRRPAAASGGREALVPGVVLGGVGGIALAIVALRPTEVADFAATHHSVVAFAMVIAALAASLVSGFTVALRR